MENKYEIGDIVCIKNAQLNSLGESSKFPTIGPYLINQISGKCVIRLNNKDCTLAFDRFRPATPEEITQYKKDNGIVDEIEFEVGKWYKLNNWYSKFKKLKNKNEFWGEAINTDSDYHSKDGYLDLNAYTPKLLTDLSEIQQYLPSGHPDLLPKEETMKTNELTSLPEKWYIEITKETLNNINKFRSTQKTMNTNLRESDFDYFANSADKGIAQGHTYKPENYTEITLDQFKKWVLKESIDKIDNIPEYVECYYSTDKKLLGVYKVDPKSKNDRVILPEFSKLRGTTTYDYPMEGSIWKFKISTKEAYDMQNKPKVHNLLDVEVGDTVRCIENNNSKYNKKGGSGWSKNYEFVINKIHNYSGHNVYFPKKGSGVYSEFVELVKKGKSKEELNKEELLEEAKKIYPVGTEFKCVNNNPKDLHKCIIKDHNDFQLITLSGKWSIYHGNNWIFMGDRNQWAEIISLPEDKVAFEDPFNSDMFKNAYYDEITPIVGRWYDIEAFGGVEYQVQYNTDWFGCKYISNTHEGEGTFTNVKIIREIDDPSLTYDPLGNRVHEKYFMGTDYSNIPVISDPEEVKNYLCETSSNLISYDDEPMVLDVPKRVNSISTKFLVLED